jgi:hypothetical protein
VAEGAKLEVWEAAFDGGIPHMVVLSNGAAGFVLVWPTTVVLGGGLGFAVDFGVGGCHGFRAGDLGGASAMVQLF